MLRMIFYRASCLQHISNANFHNASNMCEFIKRRQFLDKFMTKSSASIYLNSSSSALHTSPPYARRPELNFKDSSFTKSFEVQQNQQNHQTQKQQVLPQHQHPHQNQQHLNNKQFKMSYNIDWIFASLRNPSKLWYVASQISVTVVGIFCKIVLFFMNRTRVYHLERLVNAVAKRPSGMPLVTVSNHHSCFDDPGLWGVLPLRYVCNTFRIRWSMAAHDICFTNKFHSLFFMHGKCIPVVRGLGVYQNAVDLCIEKCALGHWVHVFPEGKVNMTKEEMRLKWGVGRIIYESPCIPIILPMWHEGMDEVLPNVEPYILKWRKRVTLNIGEPLDLHDFIKDLKDRKVPEPIARKLITDKIEAAFRDIRRETEELHKSRS